MRGTYRFHTAILLAALIGMAPFNARAEENASAKELVTVPDGPSLLDQYCSSASQRIADEEAKRREERLRELQSSIDQKLALLREKQRELQELQKKREQDLAAARQEVVDIYSKMEPEAAASQISKLDPRVAVALLRKLPTRNASEILNVMDPAKAAILIGGMSIMAAPGRGTGRS